MRIHVLMAAVAALTSASVASADVQFSVTDLGSLGGVLGARGASVGSSTMVAGTSSLPGGSVNAMTAVINGSGIVTRVKYPGLPGGSNSYGMGIGGVGGETLVGYAESGFHGPFHAIAATGGVTTDLHGDISGSTGFSGATVSQATAINGLGDIVGQAKVGSGYTAFSLSGGAATAIPYLGGYTNAVATAVNDGGTVVGFDYTGAWNYSMGTSINGNVSSAEAFSWDGSTLVGLGTLGGLDSIATAVNSTGDIVGQSTSSITDTLTSNGHAFLYSGGTMTPLTELAGAVTSIANDVNDAGVIVGSIKTTGGFKAFIYQSGTMLDLNTLIGESGWIMTEATSINEDGYITGYGTHNGVKTAFLLAPVAGASPVTPEPGSVALLGLGAVGLVARRRRRRA